MLRYLQMMIIHLNALKMGSVILVLKKGGFYIRLFVFISSHFRKIILQTPCKDSKVLV